METLPSVRQEIDTAYLFSSVSNADFEEVETNRIAGNAPEHSREGAGLFAVPRMAKTASWDEDAGTWDENTPDQAWSPLSPWSQSAAKRIFDCVCVILSMPLALPLMLVTGLLVRFTSRGPVLFLQERMGCNGRTFTIIKFRTMAHAVDPKRDTVTTTQNQEFTSIGPFLRRWKLDELPQIVNVLLGHMSLIGPRPKMPVHVVFDLPCRPGITGLATIVFANEEMVFARIPKDRLSDYYHWVVLPAKRQLDNAYMSRATFITDFRLLVDSVLRRWDRTTLTKFIAATADLQATEHSFGKFNPTGKLGIKTARAGANIPAETDQVSAY